MSSNSNGNPAAAFELALGQFQEGRLTESLALCTQILRTIPDHADATHLSGMIHARTGNNEQALLLLRAAEKLNPENPAVLANLGNVLSSLRRFDEALSCYDRATTLLPTAGEIHSLRGNALRKSGQFEAALAAYVKALALNPGDAETLCNQGIVLKELGRYDQAVRSCDAAIALQPRMAQAHANRGAALAANNRHKEALSSLNTACELAPAIALIHMHMGISFHALGQFQFATEKYRQAISLNPTDANAHHNLGISLLHLRQHEAALESFENALSLNSQLADVHVNRGLALAETGKPAEALVSYEQAIKINPALRIAHRNQGHLYLQLAQYEKGWEKLEWRLISNDNKVNQRLFSKPLWLGQEALAGKTVLLHSEQGLGDTLQFCRYARHVSALGARVILEVQQPLLRLLHGLDGVSEVVIRNNTPPAFDFHCPLMSLPLALKKSIGSTPAACTPIRANDSQVKVWQARLQNRTRPRIGFVWRGNQQHKNDHNRSIPLPVFTNLLDGEFEFICLQKEMDETERQILTAIPGILQAGEHLQDFSDTAALCETLDLIITVDTSVAHLAGSMGKPVWILLPFNPDWRWMLERSDTPWYPSARLYRSERLQGWQHVIAKVREDLQLWEKPG
jgi:tetratricopeptide (TPR) repeat protein